MGFGEVRLRVSSGGGVRSLVGAEKAGQGEGKVGGMKGQIIGG